MSVSLNWQPILGGLLLVAGAAFAAFQWWRARPTVQQAAQTARPSATDQWLKRIDGQQSLRKRAADEPAPPGAVEWVEDICGVIEGAPDSLILSVLKKGGSRESALIAERETRKPSEPTA